MSYPFITYDNLKEFLTTCTDSCSKNIYEEDYSCRELGIKIGTLYEERLYPYRTLGYKTWTHYAIGFYPYNMCGIYMDNIGRILLSYTEMSGHLPL